MNAITKGAKKFDVYCRRQGGSHRYCLHVAEVCGVTIGTVYRWRAGEHRPSLDCAAKLERLTGGEVLATDWATEEERASA